MKEQIETIKAEDLSSITISEFTKKEPAMSESAYNLLKSDIKKNGQKNPVIVCENKIYDGRNRYRAIQELEKDLEIIRVKGTKNAETLANSNNKFRRHITKSQYAMMSAMELDNDKSIKLLDSYYVQNGFVSDRTVKKAKQILKYAKAENSKLPDLADDVYNAKISLEDAQSKIKELEDKNEEKKNKESSDDENKKFLKENCDESIIKEYDDLSKKVGLSKVEIIKNFLYTKYTLKDKLSKLNNRLQNDDDKINVDEILAEIDKALNPSIEENITDKMQSFIKTIN